MTTKESLVKYLLENHVDNKGNLDLTDLDFSTFDGDIYIGFMKVKNNLFQNNQTVGGELRQSSCVAKGSINNDSQKAGMCITNYGKEESDKAN